MSLYKYIENHWIVICVGIVVIFITLSLFKLFKNTETFTNDSGYFCDPKECEHMTISDCMKCSNCGYCMNDFSSKCVSGSPRELIESGKCSKVYANDAWTRAVMAGDNDYVSYENKSIFD